MRPITDEQIETLKAVYAESGVIRSAARAAGVSPATAKKYVDANDGFEQARTEKRVDIIAKIADVQIALLDAMIEPTSLAKSSLQEKATSFGIVTDKAQLLAGEPTERHEHRDLGEAVESFASRVDELASRRRPRGIDGVADGATGS